MASTPAKSYRLPPDLLVRAAEAAEARGCTVTELVEQGLRAVVDGDVAALHRSLAEARRDLLSIRVLVDARLEALLEPDAVPPKKRRRTP
jgi:hypothetical protein